VVDEAPAGALDAVTVIDLSEGVAAAYAARLLAGCGARVIKVERPGVGDLTRRQARLFEALNAGKESITLDYETATGASLLARLAEFADAFIEEQPGRRRADLALDSASLLDRVPRLVISRVSAYGASGPYADYPESDLTTLAAAGRLEGSALPPAHAAAYETGVHAFTATLAALWAASQTEHGQEVEIAALEALAAMQGRVGAALALPTLAFGAAPWHEGTAPALGEHNGGVFGELLGLTPADLVRLRGAGVV
jgi:crotonobetainyl-CoA:carnitine CoA-transferase CaiB-like acyl-CoA transferase